MTVGSHDRTKLLKELFPDGNLPADIDDLRFVFVCRAVLGVFLQVGEDRNCQLNSTEPVFSAGRVRQRQFHFSAKGLMLHNLSKQILLAHNVNSEA